MRGYHDALVAFLQRGAIAPHVLGVAAPNHPDTHLAEVGNAEPNADGDPRSQRTRRAGRRRSSGHGPDPVVGIAHRSHWHDVERKQLEHDAHCAACYRVAHDHAGHRPRNEWARKHHLPHAHEIEPDDRAPQQEPDPVLHHVNPRSATGRAVGTSCAVTSTPFSSSARSPAASSSER